MLCLGLGLGLVLNVLGVIFHWEKGDTGKAGVSLTHGHPTGPPAPSSGWGLGLLPVNTTAVCLVLCRLMT